MTFNVAFWTSRPSLCWTIHAFECLFSFPETPFLFFHKNKLPSPVVSDIRMKQLQNDHQPQRPACATECCSLTMSYPLLITAPQDIRRVKTILVLTSDYL